MLCLHRRIRIQRATVPGVPHGRRGFRLYCKYSNLRINLVRDDAIAGSATASAGGSDNHIDVGQVFKDLETDRADPGNQLRFVRRVNVTKAFFPGDAFAFQPCFVKIAAVQTNFGAQVAHRLHLRFVYVLGGSVDGYRRSEESPAIGNRLAVIAGGGGNQHNLVATAPGADLMADKIDATANLEG